MITIPVVIRDIGGGIIYPNDSPTPLLALDLPGALRL